MLRHVLFDLSLFADESERANSQKRVLALLQALTYCNQLWLRQHPETPFIYQSGIKYKVPAQVEKEDLPEVGVLREYLSRQGAPADVVTAFQALADMCGGGEHFREIPRIIENGGGDCFPLTQKIIVRSRSTGMYELLALGELRHVYPSYEALSYNFTKARYDFKPIIGFVDKGVKSVCKAHLSNGTDLVATPDHKFWTLDGSGVNGRRLGVRTMREYVEAMKMSRGMRTARSRIVQAARIPVLSAVRPNTAVAYLAGIYAAEGNFDGKHTAIAQHKAKVRAKIEMALAEVATGFRYREGGRSGKTTPGSGAYYALHGGAANPIVAMMREQGLTSFDKSLPQAFLSGDEETLARMVEGHGDGDAWRPADTMFKRPEVDAIYATSSDVLMEQLRFALLALGRPTYAYRQEDHQGEGQDPIWRLHEYGARGENSTLRKRRELVEQRMDLDGLTYGVVLNAKEAGEAHVGCIEVEGNHNFFLADGTLVSNCDNVASWRAAELRELGINARPYITWRQRADGGYTYHVIVWYPDGTHEDSSLLLGMGGAERAADRAEEERKLGERAGNYVKAMQAGSVDLADTIIRRGGSDAAVAEVLGALGVSPSMLRRSTILGLGATGGLPSDFGKGIQYSIPFQSGDDSYADWSPTRPQAYYADPRYPGGGPGAQGGPLFNTRLRDPDDDDDDRFDGATPIERKKWEREIKRILRRAA
jgi:hypothetical protein